MGACGHRRLGRDGRQIRLQHQSIRITGHLTNQRGGQFGLRSTAIATNVNPLDALASAKLYFRMIGPKPGGCERSYQCDSTFHT